MLFAVTSRLQNSPYFCVFKYARAVKQKVWNEAELILRKKPTVLQSRLPETIPRCSDNMVMHYNHCFIPIYQQTYKAIYFDTNLLKADKV